MIKLSTVLLMTTVCAGLVFGQPPRPFNTSGTPGTPPDPATMAQTKVSFLATLLSLTDAQKTQAITIYTNAFTAEESVHTTLQTDLTALATAVKSNNTATIDQLAAAIGTLQGQVLDINSKADAAFYAILTSDQQAKFDLLPHGGPGGGPGGRFGPRGMTGPRP